MRVFLVLERMQYIRPALPGDAPVHDTHRIPCIGNVRCQLCNDALVTAEDNHLAVRLPYCFKDGVRPVLAVNLVDGAVLSNGDALRHLHQLLVQHPAVGGSDNLTGIQQGYSLLPQ